MPVEFLSDEHARRYGRYQGDPNPDQLERFFAFGDAELTDISRQRSVANRLGYAVQLGTVRFLGCFVDLHEVPGPVVHRVATVLRIEPEAVKAYSSSASRFSHAVTIRERYGYTTFGEGRRRWRFLRGLFERVWTRDDRPTVLVDLATYWLVENRVLLPGITTLTSLIASGRDRARRRAWQAVSVQLGPGDVARLERLVEVDDSGVSMLQRLRRAPSKRTIDGLLETLERLAEVQVLAGSRRLELSRVPAGRVRALAQDAATVKAQRVARQTPARRAATLAAFTERLLREAHDDAIDVFLVVAHDLVSRTERAVERDRVATLDQLDAASRLPAPGRARSSGRRCC